MQRFQHDLDDVVCTVGHAALPLEQPGPAVEPVPAVDPVERMEELCDGLQLAVALSGRSVVPGLVEELGGYPVDGVDADRRHCDLDA